MEEFWELFGREDELGLVVRAHLHFEFLVQEFIDKHQVTFIINNGVIPIRVTRNRRI